MNRKVSDQQNSCKRVLRRRNIIRKRVIFLVLLVVVFLSGILLGTSIVTSAASGDENTQTVYKYYTSIRINQGDSLWSIAKQYRTEELTSIEAYIKEVKTLNQLKTNHLNAGEYLCIPFYSEKYK